MAPVDRYRFRGTHVRNRATREGVGAPIVAIGRGGNFTERDRFAQGDDIFHGMTALLRFDGVRMAFLAGGVVADGQDFAIPSSIGR